MDDSPMSSSAFGTELKSTKRKDFFFQIIIVLFFYSPPTSATWSDQYRGVPTS